jgi:hypothetical protein
MLKASAVGIAGFGMLSSDGRPFGLMRQAHAKEYPAVGTYPECCSGSSVFIGITVPPGAYWADGACSDCAARGRPSGSFLLVSYTKALIPRP